jgi:hypothetical protein
MEELFVCIKFFHISFSAKETWRKENSRRAAVGDKLQARSLKFLFRLRSRGKISKRSLRRRFVSAPSQWRIGMQNARQSA